MKVSYIFSRLAAALAAAALLAASPGSAAAAASGDPFVLTSAVEYASAHDKIGGWLLDDGERFARASAALGDLDGDGFLDILIGASRDNDGATKAGALYVMFMGGGGGDPTQVKSVQKISALAGGFADAPAQDGGAYPALKAQDKLGYCVAALGDLDGEGTTDVFASVTGSDGEAGSGYVLFLRPDGTVRRRQRVGNAFGGLAAGTLEADGGFGQACGYLGTDAAGRALLGVGAPDEDGGYGRVHVLALEADGSVATHAAIGRSAGGGLDAALERRGQFGGRAVVRLGDLDGDGADEVLVGARSTDTHGAVFVLSFDAAAGGLAAGAVASATKISGTGPEIGLTDADANAQRHTASAEFGNAAAALGDVTGDGVPDVAVSANNAREGVLYLLALNADGSVRDVRAVDKSTLAAAPDLRGDADLPALDRWCRSLSAPGISAADGGFSIVCGGGAGTTGDAWLLTFSGTSDAASSSGGTAPTTAAPTAAPTANDEPTSSPATSFEPVDGLTYCAGGTTLSSNWNHGTQLVTGPLTLAGCQAQCAADDACAYMTVKAEDGRCITKADDCEVRESTEGSTTYIATHSDVKATPTPEQTAPEQPTAKPTPEPTQGGGGGGGGKGGGEEGGSGSGLKGKGEGGGRGEGDGKGGEGGGKGDLSEGGGKGGEGGHGDDDGEEEGPAAPGKKTESTNAKWWLAAGAGGGAIALCAAVACFSKRGGEKRRFCDRGGGAAAAQPQRDHKSPPPPPPVAGFAGPASAPAGEVVGTDIV